MNGIFAEVGRLEAAMTFHRDRHAVLSGNVANVETPGYQPLELERVSPLQSINEAELEQTRPGHVATSVDGSTRLFVDGDGMVGLNGNGVQLERELAKLDANRVRYTTSSDLVSRRLAMLRYAATDGQG